MIIVISPAKTVDFETPPQTTKFSIPDFLTESNKLVREMRNYSRNDIKKLMHVSDKIADLNVARFKEFKTPFTPKNAKQAALAFKGDVYTGLNIDEYTAKDLDFAQKHLRILSGLYGILRPLDLMQAYRLEMGLKLQIKTTKNLYEFWDDQVTEALNAEFKKQKENSLINLASNEYFKVIQKNKLNGTIITPAFKEARDDGFKIIGIYAKKARGLMSSFIIKNKMTNPEDIKAFNMDGYKFNKKLSTDTDWTFTRKQ